MSIVENRYWPALRADDHVSCGISFRSKSVAGVILLVSQLANGRVQRHGPDVVAVVEEDFGLAITERIDVDAETRRPISSKNIRDQSARSTLLFKAGAGEQGDVSVDLPIVVRIGSFINPLRQNLRG